MQASPVVLPAPPGERFRAKVPIAPPIDPSVELDLVELGALGAPHPLVYVHTEDREALDALILAGLVAP